MSVVMTKVIVIVMMITKRVLMIAKTRVMMTMTSIRKLILREEIITMIAAVAMPKIIMTVIVMIMANDNNVSDNDNLQLLLSLLQ